MIIQSFRVNGQENSLNFSKEQIVNDLAFLELNLQKFHPNLYVYSSQEKISDYFKNLTNSIPDSLSQYESLRLISSVSSVVKDGHFMLSPDKNTLNDFYTTSKLLPIDIFWSNKNAYLIKAYTKEGNVLVGSKILSINGVSTEKIQKEILKSVPRDGNNTTYPNWILNTFFRAYYNFYFGNSESYLIKYVNSSSKINTIKLKGLTYSEIRKNSKETHSKANPNPKEKGINLEINYEFNSALLTIKIFENKELKSRYNQKFKKEIKTIFKRINKEKIEHLIIDIRGNQGGEVTNGIYLLQHLLAEPFITVEKLAKVDKKNCNKSINRTKELKVMRLSGSHNPVKKNNYKNELYIMVNGGSFSCSGIFSQVIKKTKRGLIVGTETGGSAYTLVGAPNKNIILPNTKIQVTIPTRQFILQDNIKNTKEGTIPDLLIETTISDILNNKDVEYEYIIKLIEEKY